LARFCKQRKVQPDISKLFPTVLIGFLDLHKENPMTARRLFLFVVLLGIVLWQPCLAEVDLGILRNIAVDATPLDIAVSEDGRWIYVLTDDARLQIYSQQGALKGTVTVPAGSQRIASGPGDDVLFVTNPSN
jgi:hypothetical protein